MRHVAIVSLALLTCYGCGSSDRSDDSVDNNEPAVVEPTAPLTTESLDPTLTQPTGDSALSPSQTEEAIQSELAPIPTAAGTSSIQLPIAGKGNEPFWTLSIDDSWISFERHGLPVIDAPFQSAQDSETGETIISADELTVVLDPTGCSIDLGDSAFSHAAIVRFEDTDYEGCAIVGDASPETASDDYDWTSLVPETIGAIDACLSKAPDGSIINAIYPRDENLFGIILSHPDGRQEECGATADGATLAFLDPIEPGTAEIWMESGLSFARGSEIPARCDGERSEPLLNNGAQLGHLIYGLCAPA